MHKHPVFASIAGAKQSRIVFARALDCHAALRLAMTGVIVMFEALLRMVHRHIILILLLNNSVRVIRNMHKHPVFASTAGAKQSRTVLAQARWIATPRCGSQ